MVEMSIAVMVMLHAMTISSNRGAQAFHLTPPRSFYPPPGFDGGGRGRRYDGDDEDDFDDDGSGQEGEDWFYGSPRHHHDPYFHYDDLPFPPPPRYHHPRFMVPPPPHVIITETPAEIPQSQLLTTGATTREGSSTSLEHERERQQQKTQTPPVQSIWKTSAPVLVQSSALKTFAFDTPTVERVQVLLKTGHRHGRSRSNPLQALIDVWHGPDSTPQNLAIYLEDDEDDDEDDDLVYADGASRDEDEDDTTNFSAIIETPQGYNTIAVRNTATNFDLLACVEGEECEGTTQTATNGVPHHFVGGDPSGYYYEEPYGIPHSAAQRNNKAKEFQAAQGEATSTTNSSPLQSVIERLMATSTPQLIEGTTTGASRRSPSSVTDKQVRPDVHTVRLAQNVASVQVLLRTDYMRPLQARVELILKERSTSNKNDPGRVLKRTIVEVFSEDGMHRPFFAILETPKKRRRKRRHRQQQEADDKKYTVSLRVINLSGSEFPLFASVEPYVIDTNENLSTKGPTTNKVRKNSDPSSNTNGDGEDQQFSNDEDNIDENDQQEDDDIMGDDWWEQSMENSHFGGGSRYDMSTNSTILDAEIL